MTEVFPLQRYWAALICSSLIDICGQPVGLALNMGPTGCPQTSVTTNHRYALSLKSEDLIDTATEA
jgi:hypothetical protein